MSDEFDFEVGDTVLIRVRESRRNGRIKAKIEAQCTAINDYGEMVSPKAVFDAPWGRTERIKFRPYDAEFEVID